MPFDGMRMIFGGFTPVATLEKRKSNKTGDYIWYELLTSDAEAAQKFYASVLGWSFADSGQAGMDYRIINAGAHSISGLKYGRTHGCNPVTNAHIVSSLLLETKKSY